MSPTEIIATNEDLGRPIDSECVTYDVFERRSGTQPPMPCVVCDTIEQAENYIRDYQMDAYVVRTAHRVVGEYEMGKKSVIERGELTQKTQMSDQHVDWEVNDGH